LGQKSKCADVCFAEGFVGTGFMIQQDLTGHLPEQWREFNRQFVPVYLETHPGKSRISAGLACGALWTISKGVKQEDVLLCPDGTGRYRIGRISGPYYYAEGKVLPHRRPVEWLGVSIDRADMSDGLRNSCGSIGTVSTITKHAQEIERLLQGVAPPQIVSTDDSIEDPTVFALEKHLEEFLVRNWGGTELSSIYEIYSEEGELVGQQFPTDTGPIDILGISKDAKTLAVIELKRGRATDVVVGQVLRYMGFVKDELAEEHQSVRGVVIALEDDQRLRRALAMVPVIDFYRYEVSFKLVRG